MSTTRSVRLNSELDSALKKLAKRTDRPLSWHLERALKDYVSYHAWQEEQIRLAMEEIEAGNTIPHEIVKRRALAKARKLDALAAKRMKKRA